MVYSLLNGNCNISSSRDEKLNISSLRDDK